MLLTCITQRKKKSQVQTSLKHLHNTAKNLMERPEWHQFILFKFSLTVFTVFSHSWPYLPAIWIPGSAPVSFLENNILRFLTKGVRLREQHYNHTIYAHKHIKHGCHHTENSVYEECYDPCTFKAQHSTRRTCDRLTVFLFFCFFVFLRWDYLTDY